jgi:predicted phage-related endonuclease
MKKETAVEWLEEQFIKVNHLTENEWIELIQQANEMFEQQIIDAHVAGHNAPSSTIKNWDAEQYYKETFKNETFKNK